MHSHPTFGFTLIELLVVITIIVVLLALLAPALDKAIYQAELVVCAGKNRAIGAGAQVYASQYNRYYPHRELAQRGLMRPIDIQYYFPTATPARVDDRPVLRDILSINAALNCPLGPQDVDFDGSRDDTNVIADYGLWFGFAFENERRMRKLGDRFSWDGDSYNVLAGDWSGLFDDSNEIGSHNDADGSMIPYVFEDQEITTGFQDGPFNYTMSTWTTQGAGLRGLVDLNFAHTDGSVRRVDSVTWDEGRPDESDERVVQIPQWDIPSNQEIAKVQVPR